MNVESFSNLDVEIIQTRLCGEIVRHGLPSSFRIRTLHSYRDRERERRGISHGGKCGVTDFQMECLS